MASLEKFVSHHAVDMNVFNFPYASCTDNELLHLLSNSSVLSHIDALNISNIINDNLNIDNDIDLPNLNSIFDVNCNYSSTLDISSWSSFPNSFSILNINARSLNTNFDQIKVLLSYFDNKPDIITVSETWLQSTTPLQPFALINYNIISVPRHNRKRGGGVAIYVNSLLSYNVISSSLPNSANNPCEICAIEIVNDNSQNIIIVNIYKPPDSDIPTFIDFISDFIDCLNIRKKHLFITGDFNIDLLSYHSRATTSKFMDQMFTHGLFPSITYPTRITSNSASIIDNIFTNVLSTDHYSKIIFHDISDHLPIYYNCNLSKKVSLPESSNFSYNRIFSAPNFNLFNNLISNTDWNPLISNHPSLNILSPNDSYNIFYKKSIYCFQCLIPSYQNKCIFNPQEGFITMVNTYSHFCNSQKI